MSDELDPKERAAQIAAAKAIGEAVNGMGIMDIMSGLGMFSIHIIRGVAQSDEDALEGLRTHHKDVERSFEDFIRKQRTEH